MDVQNSKETEGEPETSEYSSTATHPECPSLLCARCIRENLFHKWGTCINTYHVPFNTLRSQLVHPKDSTTDGKKCGVIYRLECADCEKIFSGQKHSNTTR